MVELVDQQSIRNEVTLAFRSALFEMLDLYDPSGKIEAVFHWSMTSQGVVMIGALVRVPFHREAKETFAHLFRERSRPQRLGLRLDSNLWGNLLMNGNPQVSTQFGLIRDLDRKEKRGLIHDYVELEGTHCGLSEEQRRRNNRSLNHISGNGAVP